MEKHIKMKITPKSTQNLILFLFFPIMFGKHLKIDSKNEALGSPWVGDFLVGGPPEPSLKHNGTLCVIFAAPVAPKCCQNVSRTPKIIVFWHAWDP